MTNAAPSASILPAPGKPPRPARDWRDVVYPVLVVIGVLVAWEAGVRLDWLRPVQFPPPSKLATSLIELLAEGYPEGISLATHVAITVQRIVIGYVLALALAIPLGLLIGRVPVIDKLTDPIIAFGRSVATLSLLPLAVVWFGTGEASKIFLIGYGCFWVMLSNVVAAVKNVDPVLVRAARTMDVAGPALFRQVILPAALPRIFAGARIALGVGFMVIVGAEMIGTIQGLGALIMEARTFYRTDITMVGMFVIGVLGFAIAVGLEWFERRLLPWQVRSGPST
ncbi:MAG: ABC transporter permease [Burkholderiales bacterium]|nr:ABC transporter permease [Burkholderiales bacterium]